ncbi:MAG TPA: potassium channel family protein [Solirubrobacteraceae bacterium]
MSSAATGRSKRADLRLYVLLLIAIVTAFAIQGIASPGRWEQLILSLLLAATALLAVRVANGSPVVFRVVTVLAVGVIILSLVEAVSGVVEPLSTRIANGLLVALGPPAIFVGVIRTLRAKQAVTVEAVIGVLCVYVLIGMFFASVYGSIERLGGQFFAVGGHEAIASYLYFSFTTLSTVGYGDLTARTNLGHTLSVSEALLGQVYLVTVVSLIVANLGRRRQTPPQFGAMAADAAISSGDTPERGAVERG